MGSENQWLDWLAAAQVPAFVCRRHHDRVHIVAATPAFTGVLGRGEGRFAEADLLARLASEWPQHDDSSVLAQFSVAPDAQCVLQALGDQSGSFLGILRLTTDREHHNDAFFSTVQKLPDIVARMDRNHRHLYITPAIERMTGIAPQAFIGKSKREIGLPPDLVEQWEPLINRVLASAEPAEEEQELPTVHGPRQFLTRVVPELAADGTVKTVLSTSHDITARKSLQRQLALLANSDPLTSVLNRRGFIERVEAELSRVRQAGRRLSLLLLDVNNFKIVNDTYGHVAGDNVLIAIADALVAEIAEDDFVSRLGGDEFCVGLIDVNPDDAYALADRIRRRIGSLGTDGRCPCGVGVSIGHAAAGAGDHSVADLLARVDESMYQEKSRGSEGQ